jgi:hypothetical protein
LFGIGFGFGGPEFDGNVCACFCGAVFFTKAVKRIKRQILSYNPTSGVQWYRSPKTVAEYFQENASNGF